MVEVVLHYVVLNNVFVPEDGELLLQGGFFLLGYI
jgi:hypothetical protein